MNVCSMKICYQLHYLLQMDSWDSKVSIEKSRISRYFSPTVMNIVNLEMLLMSP